MGVKQPLRRAKRGTQGYTILELMAVVAIVGVLTAIALPAYQTYMNQSKTNEALSMLQEIRMQQESYFTGLQYCNASGTATNWNPASPPSSEPARWDGLALNWNCLGTEAPGGWVLFRYVAVAGGVGEAPGDLGVPADLELSSVDPWYYAAAIGDLDEDNDLVYFSLNSRDRGIAITNANGEALSEGWE